MREFDPSRRVILGGIVALSGMFLLNEVRPEERQKSLADQKLRNIWPLEDKLYTDYSGPHQFRPTSSSLFSEYDLSQSEFAKLETSVRNIELQLANIFGRPPVWKQDQVTLIVVNNTLRKNIATYEYVPSLYIDNQSENNIEKTNIIMLGHKLTQRLSSDKAETAFSSLLYLGHEMTHAYCASSNFPRVWREGFAKMTENILYENNKDVPGFERYIDRVENMVDEFNTWESTKNESFYSTDKIGHIYAGSGYLWYKWHKINPNFFPELRERENNFYQNVGRQPTPEEWKHLGEHTQSGFESWLEAQAILNIPDY